MLTKESELHDTFKQLCLKASEQDTIYSDRFDGMPARVLKTKTAEKLAKRRLPLLDMISSTLKMKQELGLSWSQSFTTASAIKKAGLPYTTQGKMSAAFLRVKRAMYEGAKDGLMFCGQDCGMVRDLPTCREVMERIVSEAEQRLKEATSSVQ